MDNRRIFLYYPSLVTGDGGGQVSREMVIGSRAQSE
jgi:hypothetical protein